MKHDETFQRDTGTGKPLEERQRERIWYAKSTVANKRQKVRVYQVAKQEKLLQFTRFQRRYYMMITKVRHKPIFSEEVKQKLKLHITCLEKIFYGINLKGSQKTRI